MLRKQSEFRLCSEGFQFLKDISNNERYNNRFKGRRCTLAQSVKQILKKESKNIPLENKDGIQFAASEENAQAL